MTPLLDLPAFRRRVHPMSVEAYHRLGEMGALSQAVELLRGIVVTKMPKVPMHDYVAQMLTDLLQAFVPPGFVVRPDRPLALGDSEPEPDLSVVRGRPRDWERAHPATATLVVEVATTSIDIYEGKAAIYAEAAIPEYWIVQAEERRVIVCREPTPEGYRSKAILNETDTLRCASLPGVEIAVTALFPPRAM